MSDAPSDYYKIEECPKCKATITVYDDFIGLLPDEYINERRASHTWLVCELRQEINRLKGQTAVL